MSVVFPSSSGVYYSVRMPNPADILVNGAHCCVIHTRRLCFCYQSFRMILEIHFAKITSNEKPMIKAEEPEER